MAESTQRDIPIIQTSYRFVRMAHQQLRGMPKYDRHTIGARIIQGSIDLLMIFFRATAVQKSDRVNFLMEADLQLKILRILTRLAWDMRAINEYGYIELQSILREIGKMTGGWIRSLQNSTTIL